MKFNWFKATLLSIAISGSFCAHADVLTQSHSSLSDLKNLEYSKDRKTISVSGATNPLDVRIKEMRNTALAVGAQNGFVSRINELKIKIDQNQDYMDDLYDFSVLMRFSGGEMEELYLLPPVISIVKNLKTVSDSATRIRITDKMYSIDKPGRLVSNAPNWRQYLLFDQPVGITKPVSNLLPRDSKEQVLWELWVEQGWLAGKKQAEMEMSYRIRRLGQDFTGMVRYLTEVTYGRINKPVVVSSTNNVTGGGSQMRINDKVIQLAIPAQLNSNENNWEALILDTRGSLRLPYEQRKNVKE